MTVDFSDLESQYGLPEGLLAAVQQQESGGDPNAVSPAGAIGAFQFMPDTAKQYGIDPTDPDQSAMGAAKMYADLSKKYNGDVPSMLAAYNWGQGNLDRHGLENAPAETQNYIKSIQAKMGQQPQQYASADTGIQTDATPDNSTPDLSKMSDAELDAYEASIKPQSIPDLSKMSDKELNDYEAQVKGTASAPGFFGRQATDNASALDKINSADAEFLAGQKSLPRATLDIMGAGGKAMGDLAMNAIGSVGREMPWHNLDGTKTNATELVQNLGKAAVQSQPGQWEMRGLQALAKEYPDIAGVVGDVANIAGATPVAEAGGQLAGKVIEDLPSAGAAVVAAPGAVKNAFVKKSVDYDPVATHSAISDAYGAAKKGAKPYYDLMNQIGSGEVADASDLKPSLDAMIADIQNSPFHEASSELPYLRKQAAKISDDGIMPLNDMVKLKQSLNSNFNPKRFAQGSDTPYAAVSQLVDSSLNDAALRIPDFGEAKNLADKNWLNTVKSPFEDNKILQKFWKPEDYYAKRSVDSGMLEELPDPTLQRANTMLDKVSTPVELNAIRRTLPEKLADTFGKAKIQNITQGEGIGRLSSAGQAIKGALDLTPSGIANTGRNLMNVISPRYSPADLEIINAAKSPSPALSTKYQVPFEELKNKVAAPATPLLQLPPPATITPPPSYYEPKGLPYYAHPNNPDIAVSSAGEASPMTINEQNAADVSRARANNLGLTSDVRTAQANKGTGKLPEPLQLPYYPENRGWITDSSGQTRMMTADEQASSEAARQRAYDLGLVPNVKTNPLPAGAVKPSISANHAVAPASKSVIPVDPTDALDYTGKVPRKAAVLDPSKSAFNKIKTMGGVQIGSPLDIELRNMGVNPRTRPGLFKAKSGVSEVDNIPISEWNVNVAPESENGYVPRQHVLDTLHSEFMGKPMKAAQPTADAYLDDLYREADSHGVSTSGKSVSQIENDIKNSQSYKDWISRNTSEPSSGEDYYGEFKKGGLVTPKFTHRQWLSYVQSHGKANGHTMKDKNNPDAHKKAYEVLSMGNSEELRTKLGRVPKATELELAHYIGSKNVHRLLNHKNGSLPAHKIFPAELVKDQRKLFFDKNKPYTIAQIRSIL